MNTIERGNLFRDEVCSLLAAAGFHPEKGIRIDFKKGDATFWVRDDFDGPQIYAIEAKDHEGTLALKECTDFATQYGTLVENGKINKAWLLSKGPISPDGRMLIESRTYLKCFTYESFQRRLLRIDGYLRELIRIAAEDQIDAYYVRPHTADNTDLEDLVIRWIDEPNADPLAIIGGYGKGKTTFAKHFAAKLAESAIRNTTSRAPVLVPLGEIVDEQSVDGLIGKILASQFRTGDYHFEIFDALNKAGRFVVVFDGFDEMKHGMTIQRFENIISELMKLDKGNARVIILGRDTAFHDDVEFRAVILGRQLTLSGQEVPSRYRRPFKHVELREFTLDEAKSYVERYFPLKAQEECRRLKQPLDDAWVRNRQDTLLSGTFDDLIARPVHAQMLCEIATNPGANLTRITKFELYDTFVHYLLDRETSKKGRHAEFTTNARRRFNSALAWWLWQEGRASTTTLTDVPVELCLEAVRDVDHDLDETGLKRELTAGCLIEKSGGTIYFGHRSIQEFLVAEYLYQTDLTYSLGPKNFRLEIVLGAMNAEIIDFIVGRFKGDYDKYKRQEKWLLFLENLHSIDVPLKGFDLFVKLQGLIADSSISIWGDPWRIWLDFFVANEAADFALRTSKARDKLLDLVKNGTRSSAAEDQAAVLVLLARVLARTPKEQTTLLPELLSRWVSLDELGSAIKIAGKGVTSVAQIKEEESLSFWAFLMVSSYYRDESRRTYIRVDTRKLENEMITVLRRGFEADALGGDRADSTGSDLECTPQALYQAFGRAGVGEGQLDRTIRRFVNDAQIRGRIRHLEIQRTSKGRYSRPLGHVNPS